MIGYVFFGSCDHGGPLPTLGPDYQHGLYCASSSGWPAGSADLSMRVGGQRTEQISSIVPECVCEGMSPPHHINHLPSLHFHRHVTGCAYTCRGHRRTPWILAFSFFFFLSGRILRFADTYLHSHVHTTFHTYWPVRFGGQMSAPDSPRKYKKKRWKVNAQRAGKSQAGLAFCVDQFYVNNKGSR